MERIALLFPGQGSQYQGMGKVIYSSSNNVKTIFRKAEEIIGYNLKDICLYGKPNEQMEHAQVIIFLTGYCSWELYKERFPGALPRFMAGHSLGELTALACGGALSFEDMILLVAYREKCMNKYVALSSGMMISIIGVKEAVIEEICNETKYSNNSIVISNYNSFGNTVISGEEYAIKKIALRFEQMGGKIIQLNTSGAFHHPNMYGAAKEFQKEVMKYNINLPDIPVVSNYNGFVYESKEQICSCLVRNIYSPVKWRHSLTHMQGLGVEIFIDMGPNCILKKMGRKQQSPLYLSLEEDELEDYISEKKANVYQVLETCLTALICTKNYYPEDPTVNSELGKTIKMIQFVYDNLNSLGFTEVNNCLERTKVMLVKKNVSKEEIDKRLPVNLMQT